MGKPVQDLKFRDKFQGQGKRGSECEKERGESLLGVCFESFGCNVSDFNLINALENIYKHITVEIRIPDKSGF